MQFISQLFNRTQCHHLQPNHSIRCMEGIILPDPIYNPEYHANRRVYELNKISTPPSPLHSDNNDSNDNPYVPSIRNINQQTMHYIVMDNANRMAGFFGFEGYTSLRRIYHRARQYCELSWVEAQARYAVNPYTSHEISTPRLKRYCFEAVYTLNLLHEGFGFSWEDIDDVTIDFIQSSKPDLEKLEMEGIEKVKQELLRVNNYLAFADYVDHEKMSWGIGAIAWELHKSCWRSNK